MMCTSNSKQMREMTLVEEIMHLPIDANIKDRIIHKIKMHDEREAEMNRFLENCHKKIDRLETTIKELLLIYAKDYTGVRRMNDDRYASLKTYFR